MAWSTSSSKSGPLLTLRSARSAEGLPTPCFTRLQGCSVTKLRGSRRFSKNLIIPDDSTTHANRRGSGSTCRCEAGARKHGFVALFQSLTALTILRDAAPEAFSQDMLALLAEPESEWLLGQSKLRNGLIHLGMQDVASKIKPGDTIDDAVAAYTNLAADEVAARVSEHLSRFVTVLTSWMLTPPVGGSSFMAALHRPPAD